MYHFSPWLAMGYTSVLKNPEVASGCDRTCATEILQKSTSPWRKMGPLKFPEKTHENNAMCCVANAENWLNAATLLVTNQSMLRKSRTKSMFFDCVSSRHRTFCSKIKPGLHTGDPIYCGMLLVEESILVFALHEEYIRICMVVEKAQLKRNTKNQTGGEPWTVWLGELLSDFIELYSLLKTSLALWSWTQSRFEFHLLWYATRRKIYPIVCVSWKICTVRIRMVLKKAQQRRNRKKLGGELLAVWVG